MNIVKAYEMLIAAQGGRSAAAASHGTAGDPWMSAGIYGAVSAISRLIDRLSGSR